jgi:preprotein translocase subunit SecG
VTALIITLNVLLALTSILLTMLILLHKGRGGGLSDMFGGGTTSSFNASGVAQRNLNRITIVVSTIWFLSIVGIGLLVRFNQI